MKSQKPVAQSPAPRQSIHLLPLKGVRVLSLSLNLPGPAALMRCQQMGARCVKLNPPAPQGAPAAATGDPMSFHLGGPYAQLHNGVKQISADLKTAAGQKTLHRALAKTDVMLTSFRPSALTKLGLNWKVLHKLYPALSQVAIVGAAGARAEEPGHDLTYMADNGLVKGLELPPTLYADMGGSLMASEAVLQAALLQKTAAAAGKPAKGVFIEVALADASAYLGLPLAWGLTRPPGARGKADPGGSVGGAHAGYRVYPCKDGRVAVAALEPHFAKSLREAAGLLGADSRAMLEPATHQTIAAFLLTQSCKQLDKLAVAKDIPLHTMSA
jgi:alpha-methylacyl-CoA racemase